MDKPSLFIGSSSEGLEFARAVRTLLAPDAEVTLWNEGFSTPGVTFIESLINSLPRFDFAALVLTADDPVQSRDLQTIGPRDNVIFELGLFMGRLGRARTFIIHQANSTLKIPTDLLGMSVSTYIWPRSDENYESALGPACDKIRRAIRDLSFSETKASRQIQGVRERQEELHQEVTEKVSLLENEINDFLISTVLDAYEYVTIRKISGDEQDDGYRFNQPEGQSLLERLRNRGLVEEKDARNSIFSDRSDRHIKVRGHFIVTEKGKRYLNAIDQRGLGNELERIVKRGG